VVASGPETAKLATTDNYHSPLTTHYLDPLSLRSKAVRGSLLSYEAKLLVPLHELLAVCLARKDCHFDTAVLLAALIGVVGGDRL
jgi:hypothetical protein